jgi:hypothetical protein
LQAGSYLRNAVQEPTDRNRPNWDVRFLGAGVGSWAFKAWDIRCRLANVQPAARCSGQPVQHYAIVIEGHDDEPGMRECNLALGGRRAAARALTASAL